MQFVWRRISILRSSFFAPTSLSIGHSLHTVGAEDVKLNARGHFLSTACCTKSNLLNFMQHKTVESKHYLHDRSRNFLPRKGMLCQRNFHRNMSSRTDLVMPHYFLRKFLPPYWIPFCALYEINSVDRKRRKNGTRMQRLHLGRVRVYKSDTNILCNWCVTYHLVRRGNNWFKTSTQKEKAALSQAFHQNSTYRARL